VRDELGGAGPPAHPRAGGAEAVDAAPRGGLRQPAGRPRLAGDVVSTTLAAVAVDGGELPLGGGLLALVRPALDLLEPGGVLAVLSSAPSLREDLPSWCRLERHEYLGREEMEGDRDRHLVQRGAFAVARGQAPGPPPLPLREGRLLAADMLATLPLPDRADPSTGS